MKSMVRRPVGMAAWLAVLAWCFAAGCSQGPRRVPVDGSVSVGGRPAEGAVVMFHPEDPALATASGVADSQGKFKLVSGAETGVPTGRYKVTVIWPDPSKKPTEAQVMMGTADAGPDLLKGKYASRESSPLSVEISDSTQTLPPFEL